MVAVRYKKHAQKPGARADTALCGVRDIMHVAAPGENPTCQLCLRRLNKFAQILIVAPWNAGSDEPSKPWWKS